MTDTFPVALKLNGRACLLVGSAAETSRRLRALLDAGASVTLVTKEPTPELRNMAAAHAVLLEERDYLSHDLQGKWLAVLCDRDPELAARIARDAEALRVFFCAVDLPAHNSFAHVGVARSGPVFLAVGTEGKAPALARRLKHELQRLIDEPPFTAFVERLVKLRERAPAGERAAALSRLAARLHITWRVDIEDGSDD